MQDLFIVEIPTNESFLTQYHSWIHGKVSKHFKRNKSRMVDTAQNVRLRLLTKDFIGRWFYKHLTDELVIEEEVKRILHPSLLDSKGSVSGLLKLRPAFIVLKDECAVGESRKSKKNDEIRIINDAKNKKWFESRSNNVVRLYRMKDILSYANFDFERYYYSAQGHTLNSDKILKLLGYSEGNYQVLQSFWRTKKLRPSEFTEHECSGEACMDCEKGRSYYRNRRISLAHDWKDPSVQHYLSKIRWNDNQVRPFLRNWNHSNMISGVPLSVVRLSPNPGIDAGLLSYANRIISNEVCNDFKRMGRNDDLETYTSADCLSPEYSNDEIIGYDADDRPKNDERPDKVFRDNNSSRKPKEFEMARDLQSVLSDADLSTDEYDVISHIDLKDISVEEYSTKSGISVQEVKKLRTKAITKARIPLFRKGSFSEIHELAKKFSCEVEDIVDPTVNSGRAILARSEMFHKLYELGLEIPTIADAFKFPEERVELSLSRYSMSKET